MSALLDAALWYAERGWRVIPLHWPVGNECSCGPNCSRSKAKHPLTQHGLLDGSVDSAIIKQWWKHWPDANVGIVAGPDSGLAILDVDPSKGGDDTLAGLQVKYGKLPETPEAISGGGGRHVYMASPPGKFKSADNSLGPGLDTKGSGGYVVAPPSLHISGRRYEWDVFADPSEINLAAVPDWIMELLNKRVPAERVAKAIGNGEVAAVSAALLRWAVSRVKRGTLPRNRMGFEMLLQARDAGLDIESSRALGAEYVEAVGAMGDHPYTLEEVEKSLGQVYARAPRPPAAFVSGVVATARAGIHPIKESAPSDSGIARGATQPEATVAVSSGESTTASEEAHAKACRLLRDGAKNDDVLIAALGIGDEILLDQLIARMAHERSLTARSVRAELKKLRRKGLRLVQSPARAGVPEILVEPGKLPEMVTYAQAALAAEGDIYQRGELLARVVRTEVLTVERGTRRASGALIVQPIQGAYLVSRLTGAARWLKFDGRTGGYVLCDAPDKVAQVLLESHGAWVFPRLVGLLEAPTLRPDGSVLDAEGYDPATGLYLDFGGCEFLGVPDSPSRADAVGALGLLEGIVAGFPFVSSVDRSVALSAMLTVLIRRSLRSAPLHAFRAPKMRSGKTLLADTASMLATGRPCAVLSQSRDGEEERKRMLAVLLAGDPVICYDNVERPLGGEVLCQVLTQEVIRDRTLGFTAMASAPTCATVLATGNNLTFEGDLTSRVVACDLDPGVERPEERAFAVDLREEVPRRRGELVAAGLTVLRAYRLACERGEGVPLPRWGGFESWDWVRGALVWLGHQDPASAKRKAEEQDPVRVRLRTLLTAWREAFGDTKGTVADLARLANADRELHDALLEVAETRGEINARSIGRILASGENRIESGMRAKRCSDNLHSKVAVWRVEIV